MGIAMAKDWKLNIESYSYEKHRIYNFTNLRLYNYSNQYSGEWKMMENELESPNMPSILGLMFTQCSTILNHFYIISPFSVEID